MSAAADDPPPRAGLPPRAFAAIVALAVPAAGALAWAGWGYAPLPDWRDAAVIAVLSIAEEIVFRAGVQRTLRHAWSAGARRIAGSPVSAANAVASALFAAAHLWGHAPLAALGVLPVSLLLGWVYERSGERLAPPAVLHLAFNALLAAASYLAARAAA